VTAEQLQHSIANGCASLGMTGKEYDDAIGQFAVLLTELGRWGARVNLTAIRDPQEMVTMHLLDSLAVRPFLRGSSVIDIGTGAGFPGLPLAIVEPERRFVLLDSNGRKIDFVQHMITKLGLRNVSAVQSRAENYASGPTFDTVVARALATISGILDFGGHLAAEKGVVLALKGKYPTEELEVLTSLHDRWAATVTEIRVPGLTQHARHIVSLERRAE